MQELMKKLNEAVSEAQLRSADFLNQKQEMEKAKREYETQLAILSQRIRALDEREAAVKEREARVSAIENVQALETKISQDRDTFLNFKNKEESALAAVRKELDELRGQLELRKQKLATDAQELEKEKQEYRTKLETELLAKVKSSL